MLFTIGHSNHTSELFLGLLRRHGIEAVADVRSRPYSRFVPHFSKERLAGILAAAGIGYLYLGAELGGQPPKGSELGGKPPKGLDLSGKPPRGAGIGGKPPQGVELGGKRPKDAAPPVGLDFAARVREPEFRAAVEQLLGAARTQRVAMVCRERDPLDCHRFHLICRAVKLLAPPIRHILPNGETEGQEATEWRLIERASGLQPSLFEPVDRLQQAYDQWWQRGR